MASHLANLKSCVPEFKPGEQGNISKQWDIWLTNFDCCLECEEVKDQVKDENNQIVSKKRALMLAIGGSQLREVFATLKVMDGSYEEAKRVLTEYYTPKRNLTAERYKFLCNKPESDRETHLHWITRLRSIVKQCEFDKMNEDEAMKLVMTLHTHSASLRKQIITGDLNLQEALSKAEMLELADKEIKNMTESSLTQKKEEKFEEYDTNPVKKNAEVECRNCGGKYPHQGKCPAKGIECHKCHKRGHFSRVCRSKTDSKNKTTSVKQLQNDSDEYDVDTLNKENCLEIQTSKMLNKVESHTVKKEYPSTEIKVKLNKQYIKMEVDSGAEVNILNESTYQSMKPAPKLKQCSVKLKPYKSKAIPVKGYFMAEITANGKIEKEAKIFVTHGSSGKNLLGRYTAFDLEILKISVKQLLNKEGIKENKAIAGKQEVNHMSYEEMRKHLTPISLCEEILAECRGKMENQLAHSKPMEVQSVAKALVTKFPEVFKGIGKHKYRKIKLNIDKDVKPIIQPQRRIPFAKREKLEEVLKELEQEGIIQEVEGPTEWISNLVLTPKADPNEIRMNIDMTTPNKAIKRTRHVIPTVEELKYKLNGMKHFSKIDLKHGYMQFELDEESRYITTFYTHKGLRQAKRLMFGINAASELFNEEIRQTLSDIANVFNIYDDIIIGGMTKEEHDRALCQTLMRLRDCGLTAKVSKCVFDVPEIEFFGLIFSETGTKPAKEKIEALRMIEVPKTATEVRSFIGLANFSCHFIPNYSAQTAPLRELTKKHAKFEWTEECQRAFDNIKNALSEKSKNTFFDPRRPTQVIVDGSKKDGLGAILAQENPSTKIWEVVRYDSRPVLPAEKNYSQIEIESAAIEWANTKYRIYLLGLPQYQIVTDHKPLVPMYNTHTAELPPRVMRNKTRMHGYAYKLVHIPGESMPSDYLSRHPVGKWTKKCNESIKETELFVNSVLTANETEALTMKELKQETINDPEMQCLANAIKSRRITKESQPELAPYKNIWTELSVHDDLVLRGHKIVVPPPLREKAVALAHDGHQGIVKSKAYLRSIMWFPNMDQKVEEAVRACHPCQVVTNVPIKEPLNMVPIPNEAWTNLRMDFYGPVHPTGEMIIVVEDEHSRYPDLEIIHSTSSATVTPVLETMLSRFGIPNVVRTDNGPPFNGKEFAQFAKYLGFEHITVAPLSPWTNGMVERFMPVVKKIIQVAKAQGRNWRQELQRALRARRATPHPSTGVAPAVALFNGRKYKTRLPAPTKVKFNLQKMIEKDGESKGKMKHYSDLKAYVKPNAIKEGDLVLCRQQKKNKLTTPFFPKPMRVISRKGTRVVAELDGKRVTRHINHFKPYQVKDDDIECSTSISHKEHLVHPTNTSEEPSEVDRNVIHQETSSASSGSSSGSMPPTGEQHEPGAGREKASRASLRPAPASSSVDQNIGQSESATPTAIERRERPRRNTKPPERYGQ